MLLDKKLEERLKRLKALSDENSNPSEHERDNALKAYRKLLNEHNIEEASIDFEKFEGSIQVTEEFKTVIRLEPWLRTVFSACSKICNTMFYRKSYGNKEIPAIIGTADNIAATYDLALWIMDSIKSEAKNLYKDEFMRKSFRLGAAAVVHKRASDLVKEEEDVKAEVPGTSLMRINHSLIKANDDFSKRLGLVYRKPRASTINSSAYNDGKTYGATIKLSGVNKRIGG